jgi:hypothetical protein
LKFKNSKLTPAVPALFLPADGLIIIRLAGPIIAGPLPGILGKFPAKTGADWRAEKNGDRIKVCLGCGMARCGIKQKPAQLKVAPADLKNRMF